MPISCDPNDLVALAKCFKCLPTGTLMEVQTYLLCQIFNGGGMGGTCAATSAIISGTDIDWTVADHRYKTIVGNTVFTFSNVTEAKTISVYITAIAGVTSTFPATVEWPGNVAPIQSGAAPTRTDIYTFVMVNGIIRGSYIQNYNP